MDGSTALLPSGRHRLELRARDYESWSRNENLKAGSTLRLVPTLVPTPFYLKERTEREARERRWGVLGAGLTFVGGSVTFGAIAASRHDAWAQERDASGGAAGKPMDTGVTPAPGGDAGERMDAGVTIGPGEAGPAGLSDQPDASTALDPINTVIPLTPQFITSTGARCDVSCPAPCCTTTEGVFIAAMSGEQCDEATGAVIIDAWDSTGQNRSGRGAASYCEGWAIMYISADPALQEAATRQGSHGYSIFGEMVDAEGNALLAVSDHSVENPLQAASDPAPRHRPAQFRVSLHLYQQRSP